MRESWRFPVGRLCGILAHAVFARVGPGQCASKRRPRARRSIVVVNPSDERRAKSVRTDCRKTNEWRGGKTTNQRPRQGQNWREGSRVRTSPPLYICLNLEHVLIEKRGSSSHPRLKNLDTKTHTPHKNSYQLRHWLPNRILSLHELNGVSSYTYRENVNSSKFYRDVSFFLPSV